MSDRISRSSRQHRAQRGFTLIELMVVLVIIGVLAALVVPNVLGRADDARVTAAKTDVNNLMQALKLYKLDDQTCCRPRARQLEALPGQAAHRPLGQGLPVRQPRHQGRSGCDVLRR